MGRSRDRSVLGFLSLSIAISTIFILFRLLARTDYSSPFFLKIYIAVVSGFAVSIFLGWMVFSLPVSISLSAMLSLISLWALLRIDMYGSTAILPLLALAIVMGYRSLAMRNNISQLNNLKIEKLEEEANILFNNVQEKVNTIKSLEEKLTHYSILKDVVEEFSSVLLPEEITRLVLEKAVRTLGKEGRTLVFLVNTEKQELMLAASSNADRIKEKKGDIFDQWILRHRKSLIIEDIEKDFRFPADDILEAKKNFKSLIATPLVSEGKVSGIIRMDAASEFAYTQDDLRLLDIIASIAAVAIQNAYLYSRTQELAIRDGITGLFVRRYFMERFHEEIKRAARKKGTFSIILFDIDHFKEYNDEYGHTAGDLVLKHLSRTVSSMTREVDILARYGGEEIILLLVGMNKKEASVEANAIRKLIESRPLTLRRKESRVTVSAGVSNYPEDSILEEELIKVADERLYKAKAEGRNKVCSG